MRTNIKTALNNYDPVELEGEEFHEEQMSDQEFEKMMEGGHRQWLQMQYGERVGYVVWFYRRYCPRPSHVVTAVVLAGLLLVMSGCSVKMELGYHGKTGRDDNTATPDLIEARHKFFQTR